LACNECHSHASQYQSYGQRLFERTPQDYVRTRLGDEIYNEAAYLEERLSNVERHIMGNDDELRGEVRVTMPDLVAQDLLLEGCAEFCKLYPQVELDILESAKLLNLANREADVAFRIVKEPPEYLIGRKLVVIHRACYMAKSNLPLLKQEGWLEQQNWIGWTDKQRRPVGKIAQEYHALALNIKLPVVSYKQLRHVMELESCLASSAKPILNLCVFPLIPRRGNTTCGY
jgi:DNA-binding transcriptional LysR family regulator